MPTDPFAADRRRRNRMRQMLTDELLLQYLRNPDRPVDVAFLDKAIDYYVVRRQEQRADRLRSEIRFLQAELAALDGTAD